MTLPGSWMTYIALSSSHLFLIFQQSIWVSSLVPDGCISSKQEAASSE